MKNLRTQDLANLLGVTPQTVRKYARNNEIPFHTTPRGQLLFTEGDVREILGDESEDARKGKTAHYVRVSSGNKEMVEAQKEKLLGAYGEPDIVIVDKASGINERRKGLTRLIEMCENNEVNTIYVTRKDRLARMGYVYLERIFISNNVRIVSLEEPDTDLTVEDELVEEIMTILSSYAGKINQRKSERVRKKLKNKLDSASDKEDDTML